MPDPYKPNDNAPKDKPPDNELSKINTDIEILEKSKILHQKTLEYNALRANFKTAEEYQQALNNLKSTEDKLKATVQSLTDWETTLKAREIAIKDKEDSIEAVCNDKLTECEDTCNKIIEDTKKECEQMKVERKEEIKKQENTEYDDMVWAFHEIEDEILMPIKEWGFTDYGEDINTMLNRIEDGLNRNATLQELWGDFKQATVIASNLIEYTQGLRDVNKYVDLRNAIGAPLREITLTLNLDERQQSQSPSLPMD